MRQRHEERNVAQAAHGLGTKDQGPSTLNPFARYNKCTTTIAGKQNTKDANVSQRKDKGKVSGSWSAPWSLHHCPSKSGCTIASLLRGSMKLHCSFLDVKFALPLVIEGRRGCRLFCSNNGPFKALSHWCDES